METTVLRLLLGLVIGGVLGWHARTLGEYDVRASTSFGFTWWLKRFAGHRF